jgi:hypothetical protein
VFLAPLVGSLPALFALLSSTPASTGKELDRPPPRAVDPSIPSAARGFQAALRTGAQLPWGDASDLQGDELSARYGWQVPLLLDVGFKLQKPIFLGLYAGAAYGHVGTGNEAEAACKVPAVSCRVLSYQVGVQGQYHFGPSDRINPWVGAGFGYELTRQSLSAPSYSEEQQSSGVTLLKLAFGIDYRSSFGFGPFVEFSAGRYEATRTEVDGIEVHEGPVNPSAWHGFLMLGARLVVMP